MLQTITHILTVDVEDYFQVEAFADEVSRDSWADWPSRVVDNTLRVLDLFDCYGAKGTFFFLGWVANRFPALVRQVRARGHELACHSYWHRPVYSLSRREFREDTRNARNAIEQAVGEAIIGYRAPTWSITRDSLWALETLSEEGFLYDSSIYPIWHDLYGVPGGQRFLHTLSCADGRVIYEFPPSTVRVWGANFPAAGGGYLRVLPARYTNWAFRHIEGKYRRPVVVYFHPWELDPQQPRINGSRRSRLRHYTNLHQMEQRLHALLSTHTFQPLADAVGLSRTTAASVVEDTAARCLTELNISQL